MFPESFLPGAVRQPRGSGGMRIPSEALTKRAWVCSGSAGPGKCQRGSRPSVPLVSPHSPGLPWEPSELSVWSGQARWGCAGSPSRQSGPGQGPAEALTAGSHSSQALPAREEGRVGTAGTGPAAASTAAPSPDGCRKLISSSEDTLTNAGLAGAMGSGFQGLESVAPAVRSDASRDIPPSVSARQEVGLSRWLL